MRLRSLILLLALALSVQLHSEPARKLSKAGVLSGSIIEKDSYHVPVGGAAIRMVTPADTLFSISSNFGTFSFKKVEWSKVSVEVICMGYETFTGEVEIKEGQEAWLGVELKVASDTLAAAKVKVDVPVMEIKGDTLKYNIAGAVKVGEDDMLGDIMSALPGVKNEDGSLEVMGHKINKIYIDGNLVFGNGTAALDNLSATDVVNVKSYEQLTDKEKAARVKTGEKEQVLNVETRSKLKMAVVAQASGSYGRNFEDTGDPSMDNRYAAGTAANFFSVPLRIGVNAYLNNMGRDNHISNLTTLRPSQEAFNRIGRISFNVERTIGSENDSTWKFLNLSYGYNNELKKSLSLTERIYNSSAEYSDRTYRSDGGSRNSRSGHSVSMSFSDFKLKCMPSIIVDFNTTGTKTESENRLDNILDGANSGYLQRNSTSLRDYDISAHGGLHMGVGEDNSFDVGIDARTSFSNGDGLQRDSSMMSGAENVWVSDNLGKSIKTGVDAHFSHILERNESTARFFPYRKLLSFSFNAMYDYSNVVKYRYADAVAEANLDSLTSELFTTNYLKGRATADYKVLLLDNKLDLSFGLAADVSRMVEDRTLPVEYNIPRVFWNAYPTLQINYTPSFMDRYSLVFLYYSSEPSVQQVNSRFDDTNPLFVKRGNPYLKQSRRIGVSYMMSNTFQTGQITSLALKFFGKSGTITNRSTFFASPTVVDGYHFPAGSTYSTYENIDGGYSLDCDGTFQSPVKPLKLNFTMRLRYALDKDYSYIDNILNCAHRNVLNLRTDFKSNFSRNHKVNLDLGAGWAHTYNSDFNNVSYVQLTAGLTSNNSFAKGRVFLNASYQYSDRLPVENASSRISTHMLNAVAGVKLLKSKDLEVSAGCYDILNSQSSFKTSIAENYVQTSMVPVMGRIWTINIALKFNSTKRHPVQPSSGQDYFMDSRYQESSLGRDFYHEKTGSRVSGPGFIIRY